jgi:acetyl-CoA carboxylase biotin carboxyl carrier protein
MTDDTNAHSEPFDLDRLKELIELMEKHGLTEVQLRNGPEQWKLRRGGHETVTVPQAVGQVAPVAAAPAQPTAAAPAENTLPIIKSPIVGTFYASPTPDDPPFVQPGTAIQVGTPVCIIEAMKVFNQVEAEISGVIDEVLVKNGDPVESGQPLFRVRPN